MARPKTRTPKEIKHIQNAICHRISTSNKSLSSVLKDISKQVDNVPDISTVWDWIAQDKTFADRYAKAKENQCEYLAEEILEISDDSSLDLAFTEEGKAFVDKENINRSRLRVDTRKWILSKLKPKKYGEKIGVEHSGEVGVTVQIIDKFEVK